jgi:ERCC4-type nuclease
MLIDDRIGSGDLVALLRPLGVKATATRLEYADVAFFGNGPAGLINVGIEVKTIGDVVNCMTSGRFAAHQLPGLLRDYDDCWLLIEGEWRADHPSGLLQVRHAEKGYWFDLKAGGRRWMWQEVAGWCLTMMVLGGVKLWLTPNRHMTARFLAALQHWHSKPFASHSSLKTFVDYKARVGGAAGQPAMLRAPTLERRVYKELPGLGWERSLAVGDAFPDLLTAFLADEAAWTRIDGIGPKTARKIHRAIRGHRIE